MKLVFSGTPEFARVALEALVEAGHQIALVLTQPDRPAGRGMRLQASSVKQYALAQGIKLAQPRSLRLDGKYPDDAIEAHALLRAAAPTVMVVAAYGLLLPQAVLDIPSRGCLNIHASLLPRWRGAAPIHRAIAAGDAETGITIMQMDAGLDTGPMLLSATMPISAEDTTATLHDRLAALGGTLIVQALAALEHSGLNPRQQPDTGVTYAARIVKEDAPLDFRLPAEALARRVRALESSATIRGVTLKIWEAVAEAFAPVNVAPGEVMAVGKDGIVVATGAGTLCLRCLQKPGGKRLAAREFLAGFPLRGGDLFDLPGA